MLTFSDMLIRLFVALLLGAIMGFEREKVGKEAGIRTSMLVCGGATIFAMASLVFPYVAIPGIEHIAPESWPNIPDRIAANIVVGIGFLGAGIIIKTGKHVKGLTTAALIWAAAAVGTMTGLGFFAFAAASALVLSGTLYFTRRVGLYEKVRPRERVREE